MALSPSQRARIRSRARRNNQSSRSIKIKSGRAPRAIQQRYSRQFYDLLDILNSALMELSFSAAVDRILGGRMLKALADNMVSQIFPQLEEFNAQRWSRQLGARAGEAMAVNLLRQTREEASQRVAARMGENSNRITAWSREHYTNM